MSSRPIDWTGPGVLRFVLAAAVVVHHTSRLALGTWAVYVFFILSGYWISRMYRETYSRAANPLLTFYASRWLRLFPMMAVAIGMQIAVLLFFDGRQSPALGALADPSWWLASATIVGSSWRPMFPGTIWSLDIEYQFYLAAPLVLLLASRSRRGLFAAACALTVLEAVILPRHPELEYRWLGPYLGFFLWGVWIDVARPAPTFPLAASGIVLWVVLFVACAVHPSLGGIALGGVHPSPLIVYNADLSLAGALLTAPWVAFAVHQPSSRLDRHLGNLAYAIYLFHLVPIEFLVRGAGHLPAMERLPYVVLCWMAIAAGSLVLYLLVDQPVDRHRKDWVRSRSIVATAARPIVTTARFESGEPQRVGEAV